MRASKRTAKSKSKRSPTRPIRLARAAKSVSKKTRRARQPKDLLGMIKSNIQKTAHRLGDGVEKTGRRIRRDGNPRAGKMIESVGNRLEHVVGG